MTRIGTGSRSAKEEVSRSSSARTGSIQQRSCFLGWARVRTPTICPPRIRRVSVRGSPCSRLWTRRGSRLPTSPISTCTGRPPKATKRAETRRGSEASGGRRPGTPPKARPGQEEQRCERRQGGVRGLRGADALQLDQGRDRAPARGGRNHRSDRLHSRDRARPRAGQREHPKGRSLAEEQLPAGRQG